MPPPLTDADIEEIEQNYLTPANRSIWFWRERCNRLLVEVKQLRVQWRYGTPFDPTGAKTGTEMHSLRARVEKLERERDEARAELDDIKESTKFVMAEDCPTDEIHCGCVPILKTENARLSKALAYYADGGDTEVARRALEGEK